MQNISYKINIALSLPECNVPDPLIPSGTSQFLSSLKVMETGTGFKKNNIEQPW